MIVLGKIALIIIFATFAAVAVYNLITPLNKRK